LLRHTFPDPRSNNHQDSYGCTPLAEAVYAAYPEAVEALLNQGADPTIRSSCTLRAKAIATRALVFTSPPAGKTPIEMAKEGVFSPIPDHINVNQAELAVYTKRREEVRLLLSPYFV
jgi:ankyrin repeat protein